MTSLITQTKTLLFLEYNIPLFDTALNMGKIPAADKMRMQTLCQHLTACVAAAGGHFEH